MVKEKKIGKSENSEISQKMAKSAIGKLRIVLCMTVCILYFAAGCGSQDNTAADAEQIQETQQIQDIERSQQPQDTEQEQQTGEQAQAEAAGENARTQDVTIVSEPHAEAPEENSSENETDSAQGNAQTEDDGKKTVSIVGDSISTFDEWIPEGYYDFYPFNGEVGDVDQTWWKMVLDDMDFKLCVNASSSGSTCIGDSLATDYPQHGCNHFRTSGLADENGVHPDIIIVYMGTNDFMQSVPIGDNDGTRHVEEGNIENFSDAYCLMLDKIKANYPESQIFCCNLTPVGGWKDDALRICPNGLGLTAQDYSRQIETIAAAKGYPVIDLKNCGITDENMSEYVSDGVHLNPEGMKLIRDVVVQCLRRTL